MMESEGLRPVLGARLGFMPSGAGRRHQQSQAEEPPARTALAAPRARPFSCPGAAQRRAGGEKADGITQHCRHTRAGAAVGPHHRVRRPGAQRGQPWSGRSWSTPVGGEPERRRVHDRRGALGNAQLDAWFGVDPGGLMLTARIHGNQLYARNASRAPRPAAAAAALTSSTSIPATAAESLAQFCSSRLVRGVGLFTW